MNTKNKRILLIGDLTNAPYHPLGPVEAELRSLIDDGIQVDTTEDYSMLEYDSLARYDLCISYTDCWNAAVSDKQAEGLSSFVKNGGSLLVIHNGISLQVHPDNISLIGAKFTGHPPYQMLHFHMTDSEHEIMSGMTPFSMEEEPYQYSIHPEAEMHILMEYDMDGKRSPAAWYRKHEAGTVVYLMPGHHLASFLHPSYRQLIRNNVTWLLADKD